MLNASRPMMFGPAPIPLSEIKAFVDLFAVQDVDFLIACVRAMDRVYLDDYVKRNPPTPPAPAKADKKRRS
jgi:hypothetical protein